MTWQTKKMKSMVWLPHARSSLLPITFVRMGYEKSQVKIISEDNQSCIKLATNAVMHKNSKHIDTKIHFIQEKLDDKRIQLVYSLTGQLAADILTKALPHVKVKRNRQMPMSQTQILSTPAKFERRC